jgi:hypothetical protein
MTIEITPMFIVVYLLGAVVGGFGAGFLIAWLRDHE